jgi:hypothetical protein
MENKNQQLTVKTQALSNQIAAAGSINELAFARKVVEFTKLKDLIKTEPEKIENGLNLIFVRATNLIGIKEAIPQINKDDIANQIKLRFLNLSLEEIDYAFKLDRYGVLGEPVAHYQLFNATYVGLVLNKYKEWLRKTRFENNIPTAKALPAPELTPEQKDAIVIKGVLDCFDWFLMTREIKPGKIYVYTFLYELKVLPVHTPEFRSQIARKAAKLTYKRVPKSRGEAKELKKLLKDLTTGKNKQASLCKELVLKNYFGTLIGQRIDLRQVLREKGKIQ